MQDELIINYRFTKNEKATALKLEYSVLDDDRYLITATAIDKKGLRCLDYAERVYFQCLNGGEAIISQGTPKGSEVIEMANGKASIEVKRYSKDKRLQVTVLN